MRLGRAEPGGYDFQDDAAAGGGVFPLNGKAGLEQFSWLSPSRWGFSAAASTSNLNLVAPPGLEAKPDPPWNHTPHIWLLDMAMPVVLTVLLVGLTWWRLQRVGAGRRR